MRAKNHLDLQSYDLRPYQRLDLWFWPKNIHLEYATNSLENLEHPNNHLITMVTAT